MFLPFSYSLLPLPPPLKRNIIIYIFFVLLLHTTIEKNICKIFFVTLQLKKISLLSLKKYFIEPTSPQKNLFFYYY